MEIEKKFAQIVSYLLHPVFSPLVGTALVLNSGFYLSYTLSEQHRSIIYFIVGFNCVVVPLLSVAYMRYKKVVPNWELAKRTDRIFPLLISSGFYFFTAHLLQSVLLIDAFDTFLVGAALAMLILAALNIVSKPSLHMAGMGGLVGAICVLSIRYQLNLLPLILVLVALSGLAGYARLRLNAHRPMEIYMGFVLGYGCQFVLI